MTLFKNYVVQKSLFLLCEICFSFYFIKILKYKFHAISLCLEKTSDTVI